MSGFRRDLFKRYSKPPSQLIEEVQRSAREEGWTPPWDEKQQSQRKAAGKKSGTVRADRSKLRLSIIRAAYALLPPKYKYEPFSKESIGALREGYLSMLGAGLGDRSGTAPTEKELDAVRDEHDALIGKILEGSAAPSCILISEANFDDFHRVYSSLSDKLLGRRSSPLARLTDEELDLRISIVLATDTDRKALQKVSPWTLRKGLLQLGIRSRRRARRFR
jgi:hypothetical protein